MPEYRGRSYLDGTSLQSAVVSDVAVLKTQLLSQQQQIDVLNRDLTETNKTLVWTLKQLIEVHILAGIVLIGFVLSYLAPPRLVLAAVLVAVLLLAFWGPLNRVAHGVWSYVQVWMIEPVREAVDRRRSRDG